MNCSPTVGLDVPCVPGFALTDDRLYTEWNEFFGPSINTSLRSIFDKAMKAGMMNFNLLTVHILIYWAVYLNNHQKSGEALLSTRWTKNKTVYKRRPFFTRRKIRFNGIKRMVQCFKGPLAMKDVWKFVEYLEYLFMHFT